MDAKTRQHHVTTTHEIELELANSTLPGSPVYINTRKQAQKHQNNFYLVSYQECFAIFHPFTGRYYRYRYVVVTDAMEKIVEIQAGMPEDTDQREDYFNLEFVPLLLNTIEQEAWCD